MNLVPKNANVVMEPAATPASSASSAALPAICAVADSGSGRKPASMAPFLNATSCSAKPSGTTSMSFTVMPYFFAISARKYSVMSPGALTATLRPRKSLPLRIEPSSHSDLRMSGCVAITGP